MSVFTDFLHAIFTKPVLPGQAPVDVHAILTEKAKGKNLDWQHSIVDLMKLCGLGSDYANRARLAKELGRAGYKGTAADNEWLHAEVMKKLAENGGRVPSELH